MRIKILLINGYKLHTKQGIIIWETKQNRILITLAEISGRLDPRVTGANLHTIESQALQYISKICRHNLCKPVASTLGSELDFRPPIAERWAIQNIN